MLLVRAVAPLLALPGPASAATAKPAEQEQTQPKQEEQKTAEQSGKTENTGAEAPPPEQKEETAEEDMTEDTISLEKFQNGEIPLP